jgi:hypothetical protein
VQFRFQQVHCLDEGLLLSRGKLVEDTGERARHAVEPFVDQGGLGVGDGGDGASPVGMMGTRNTITIHAVFTSQQGAS